MKVPPEVRFDPRNTRVALHAIRDMTECGSWDALCERLELPRSSLYYGLENGDGEVKLRYWRHLPTVMAKFADLRASRWKGLPPTVQRQLRSVYLSLMMEREAAIVALAEIVALYRDLTVKDPSPRSQLGGLLIASWASMSLAMRKPIEDDLPDFLQGTGLSDRDQLIKTAETLSAAGLAILDAERSGLENSFAEEIGCALKSISVASWFENLPPSRATDIDVRTQIEKSHIIDVCQREVLLRPWSPAAAADGLTYAALVPGEWRRALFFFVALVRTAKHFENADRLKERAGVLYNYMRDPDLAAFVESGRVADGMNLFEAHEGRPIQEVLSAALSLSH